jgi:hypothetical protein
VSAIIACVGCGARGDSGWLSELGNYPETGFEDIGGNLLEADLRGQIRYSLLVLNYFQFADYIPTSLFVPTVSGLS